MKSIRRYLTWALLAAMLVSPFTAAATQHDYEITSADANTGVTFRAAVNAALQALASLSSGASPPGTTYAYQLWADIGNSLLMIRNAANTGWITVGRLSEIYLGLAALSAQNDFVAHQRLKGDALLLRLKDTGTSGQEWAIRSDGGNFEVALNTGTEASPTWTVYTRVDVNALQIGDGTASDIRLVANNNAPAKPEIRYRNSSSQWQMSNDGSSFTSMGAPPVGAVIAFAGSTAPAGYFECDGSAVSMTTYEDLYNVIANDYGLNAGSPFTADHTTETFTAASHGLANGTVLELKNSGGALPAGLSANTKYYVINTTTSAFQLSTSPGGAAVAISDNGSGTNTLHNQFKVPDYRGYFLRGWAHGQTTDPDRAARTDRGDGTTGDNVGTKQDDAFQGHYHNMKANGGTGTYLGASTNRANTPVDVGVGGMTVAEPTTGSHGSPRLSTETRPKNLAVMYCIKY